MVAALQANNMLTSRASMGSTCDDDCAALWLLSCTPQVVLELWDRQRRLWPHMLVRVGLFDSRVPPWDPGRYVAKLKDALQAGEQAVVAHYCSSAPRQGPPAVPKPRILMQVKPCGHEGYDSPADDATLAAFLLEAINEVQA